MVSLAELQPAGRILLARSWHTKISCMRTGSEKYSNVAWGPEFASFATRTPYISASPIELTVRFFDRGRSTGS